MQYRAELSAEAEAVLLNKVRGSDLERAQEVLAKEIVSLKDHMANAKIIEDFVAGK